MYLCFRLLQTGGFIYKPVITPENGLDYVMLWAHISEYQTVVTLCYTPVIRFEYSLMS
jgi:hypothetical protein